MTGSDVAVSRMSQDASMTQPVNPHDRWEYAKVISTSDIIPKAYAGKPSNILVAMDFGQSMGLTPAESLYRIHVIQGTPTMSGELIASCVRLAGHKLRVTTDEEAGSVSCTIIRKDDPEFPFTVTRDMEWARRMGLTGRQQYRTQPLTMLQWRAVTACARIACPECLYGAGYTAEEILNPLQDVTAENDGDSRDAQVEAVTPEIVEKPQPVVRARQMKPVRKAESTPTAQPVPPTANQPQPVKPMPAEPVPEYIPEDATHSDPDVPHNVARGNDPMREGVSNHTKLVEQLFSAMHVNGLQDKQSMQTYLSDTLGFQVDNPHLLTDSQVRQCLDSLK